MKIIPKNPSFVEKFQTAVYNKEDREQMGRKVVPSQCYQ